ncbi:TPA: phosphatase PAP2 family protein [Photobacterium damselae]
MISSYIYKKYPNIIALACFSVAMIAAMFIFPAPELTSHLSDTLGLIFTILTESAGKPFFLVTIALLCFIPIVMRLPRKMMVKLWIQFAIILVLSLVAKTALKHFTAVPRPFTHELQQLHVIDQPQDFYQLSKEDKALTVAKVDDQVSHWRTNLWKKKESYSFPSGHTIFVAVCVMFWGGFFIRRRKYVPAAIIITWATGVGLSRLWLGMHWPADLLGSMSAAAILYLFVPEWDETES